LQTAPFCEIAPWLPCSSNDMAGVYKVIRVMYMQSQSFFGADSELQAQLLRYMDRSQVSLSVALTKSEEGHKEVSAKRHFEDIPEIRIHPTWFGPSLSSAQSFLQKLASLPRLGREAYKLAHFVRQNNIQIIHGTEKPRDALYGVLLAKLTGARSIVHMHVNYGDWLAPTVKWALRQADAVVTVSRFSAKSIVDYGIPAERVHVVLNALDLCSGRWNQRSVARETRQSLGIPDEAVVLGVVSRLFLYKGHRDLLEALALVKTRMPSYRLVIVGEDDPRGHPGGGSFSSELRELAARLGISENVIFTGFRTDVPQLMECFDIYTMPSWEEPFGMVYLEAMALRKPVVAWELAGPAEIVVDGETGFLVKPRAIEQLGEAILKLAQDAALRECLGNAGRRRVETVFSSQRMCSDMWNVYRSLVDPVR
jgi:glycosyltransferase involved in cell wall biosynthesis